MSFLGRLWRWRGPWWLNVLILSGIWGTLAGLRDGPSTGATMSAVTLVIVTPMERWAQRRRGRHDASDVARRAAEAPDSTLPNDDLTGWLRGR